MFRRSQSSRSRKSAKSIIRMVFNSFEWQLCDSRHRKVSGVHIISGLNLEKIYELFFGRNEQCLLYMGVPIKQYY